MPISDSNSTSTRDNSLVELVGADGTNIGNVTDSTKTIDKSSGSNGAAPPTYSIQIGADDGTNLQNLQGRTDTPEDNAYGLVVRPQPHEPSTFVIVTNAISPGNQKSMFSLLNATGSVKVVRLRSMKFINIGTTAITGVIIDFRLYRMTGHSGGTLVDPQSYDLNDTLNANITSRTGATIAGQFTPFLTRYVCSSDEWGVGSQDVESMANNFQNYFDIVNQKMNAKGLVLREGQGITFRCETNTTGGSFYIETIFTEENA